MYSAALVPLPEAMEETAPYHKVSLEGGAGECSPIQSTARWRRQARDVFAQHRPSRAVTMPAAKPHQDGHRFSWPRFSRQSKGEAGRRLETQEHGERDLKGWYREVLHTRLMPTPSWYREALQLHFDMAAVLCDVVDSLVHRQSATDPLLRGEEGDGDDAAGDDHHDDDGPLVEARRSCPAAVVFAGAPPAPTLARARSTPAERTTTLPDQARLETSLTPAVLNNCNQILPFLYLGGVDAVADAECVVERGIRAVVCCLRDFEFPAKDLSKDLEYHRVDVEDISREPIELFFPEATEFIHSWVSREKPVLVHCRAGVSRSASVVMAYLMTYQSYSLHDAFFLVRSRRSCVSPNVGFMEKLCAYEEAQQGTDTTIDINKYVSWYSSEGRAAVPELDPE